MKRKLNLTVEPALIELARKISSQKQLSISQLFEQFLKQLMLEQKGSFIDRFHNKNARYLDKLSDEDVEKIKSGRGERWK